MHGGKNSGRPIKSGRWSKHAPVRLQSHLDEAFADPELVSLRNQQAVLDALAVQRLSELGEESPAQRWAQAMFIISQFPESLEALNKSVGPLATDEMKEALKALGDWHERLSNFLSQGSQAQRAELELREIIQEQTKVARAETRREQLLAQGVTLKQIHVLLAMILASIHRHVTDPGVRRAIRGDLIRAIGPGASGPAGPGGPTD